MAPRALGLALAAAALLLLHSQGAQACTRIMLTGANDSYVLSGRSQDWGGDTPLKVDAWILPRGGSAETTFLASNRSITYTPKYGSVVVLLVDSHVTQGVNEAGLTADLLNFYNTNFESTVPEKAKLQKEKPLVAATTMVAVILQNFATVAETVEYLRADNITVMDVSITVNDINGAGFVVRDRATNHLALTDASGDSAIIEWIDGSPIIYHNRSYAVVTNDPSYNEQLSLYNDYWKPIGDVFLPGKEYSRDRFVRASHLVDAAKRGTDVDAGVAQLLSFQRAVADPLNITAPPHAASDASNTQYITVSDLTNNKLYFTSNLHPMNINFWVDLDKIDFDDGQLKVLPLAGPKWNKDTVLLQDQTDAFKPSELPEWLYKTVSDALSVYEAAA